MEGECALLAWRVTKDKKKFVFFDPLCVGDCFVLGRRRLWQEKEGVLFSTSKAEKEG